MHTFQLYIVDFLTPKSKSAFFFLDNGNAARQFFHPKNRDLVLELIEKDPNDSFEDYQDDLLAFRKILQDTNLMCRIANSTEKFDILKLERFCKKAYKHRVESFDWAILSTSIHRGLGHLTELIRRNGCIGLGSLSESPLESAHKILRLLLQIPHFLVFNTCKKLLMHA